LSGDAAASQSDGGDAEDENSGRMWISTRPFGVWRSMKQKRSWEESLTGTAFS
jgi:hypothetical protein